MINFHVFHAYITHVQLWSLSTHTQDFIIHSLLCDVLVTRVLETVCELSLWFKLLYIAVSAEVCIVGK